MLAFSILVPFIDTRLAAFIGLILSLFGVGWVSKYSRIIYNISLVTFLLIVAASFTLFHGVAVFYRFVIAETLFWLLLLIVSMFRNRITPSPTRKDDLMPRNYLNETYRIVFQTQFVLLAHLLLISFNYLIWGIMPETPALLWVFSIALAVLILSESFRLHLVRKRLHQEEWLPVVNERGDVTGRIARSFSRELQNKYMHPVVRIAVIYKGKIYLQKRDASALLNSGRWDYPFERFVQFNDEIDGTLQACISGKCKYADFPIPFRFLLKYTFENEVTKRLIFLYVADLEDEKKFEALHFSEGKLWTVSQIEDNLGAGIFSECFEMEFEYLKNTVLLAQQFRHRLQKAKQRMSS